MERADMRWTVPCEARRVVLAIMKDSHLGTFGTVALVWVLLGKWIAMARLVEHGGWAWIIGAWAGSRVICWMHAAK